MAPSSSELKSSQEYPVNAGLPHGSIFGPTFFLLYTDVLLLSMVIIHYSKCNQASDLWQQSYLRNLNLICGTLWIGAGSNLLRSVVKKRSLFYLTIQLSIVLLIRK